MPKNPFRRSLFIEEQPDTLITPDMSREEIGIRVRRRIVKLRRLRQRYMLHLVIFVFVNAAMWLQYNATAISGYISYVRNMIEEAQWLKNNNIGYSYNPVIEPFNYDTIFWLLVFLCGWGLILLLQRRWLALNSPRAIDRRDEVIDQEVNRIASRIEAQRSEKMKLAQKQKNDQEVYLGADGEMLPVDESDEMSADPYAEPDRWYSRSHRDN